MPTRVTSLFVAKHLILVSSWEYKNILQLVGKMNLLVFVLCTDDSEHFLMALWIACWHDLYY